jgi:fosfomycin resistance protein FosX
LPNCRVANRTEFSDSRHRPHKINRGLPAAPVARRGHSFARGRHFRYIGGNCRGTRMIRGLSHMTFIVRDLDRMEAILTGVLGARRVYDSGEQTFSLSRERFFLVGDGADALWIAIMEGEPLPGRSYNHIAFKIDDADFDTCLERVRKLGLDMREGRSRVEGEGRSIYFYDDDNHMFELHTSTLEQRLERYAAGR